MKFEKLPISEQIKKNLLQLGFHRTTDIQYKAIPSILDGEDVLAIAPTGTGKTGAFAIPIIDKIHRSKVSKRAEGIQCLVLVPTRELAEQIGQVFFKLTKHTKVFSFALYGGVEQEEQIRKIGLGIDVLIATPGRMFDLINQKVVDIRHIETLVLDEADHMLDLGFIEDIEFVKRIIKRRHQTLFFSATINKKIKKLAFSQVRSNAIRIQISPKNPISKNVVHSMMKVATDDKRFFLKDFLANNPEGKVVVFVRTKVRAERVKKYLQKEGIECLAIHGDVEQSERAATMEAFKNNECQILIATDLTARGIDVADVTHVINYDLPSQPQSYVHRVGRTGRGFNKGEAISFCGQEELELLQSIEEYIGETIHEIKVDKMDYQMVSHDMDFEESIKLMIETEEYFEQKKRRRKAKKK